MKRSTIRRYNWGEMSTGSLSVELIWFLNQFIHSIRQMETLLFFVASPTQEFSASVVAKALGSEEGTTETWLQEFCDQGFLSCAKTPDKKTMFRFFPMDDEKKMIVQSLAKEYKVRPLKVIDAIVNKTTNKMLGFMQAFKLGKKGPNDPDT